jgi:hypothetical protein
VIDFRRTISEAMSALHEVVSLLRELRDLARERLAEERSRG